MDAQLKGDFLENGFAVIPRVLIAADVAEIHSQLAHFVDRFAGALPPGDIYFEDEPKTIIKAMHNLDRHSKFFAGLMGDARLLSIAETVFGTGGVSLAVSFFAKPARAGSVTPPHQDQIFQFWRPPEAFTLTIALDESTPENGPLICQKGSHRLGLLPHLQSGVLGFSRRLEHCPPVDEYHEVALCMRPGDVSLHHVLTVHRSDGNSSEHPRWQLGIGYRSDRASRDEEAFSAYLKALTDLHAAKA